MENEETQINYIPTLDETTYFPRPTKKIVKKKVAPKNNPNELTQQEINQYQQTQQKIRQIQEQQQSEQQQQAQEQASQTQPTSQPTPMPINTKELKETMGFDTLNPFLYKFTNYLLLPGLLSFITLTILTLINYFFFPTLTWNLYGFIICTIFSLITFILLFLLISTSLKRGDLIIIRKYRSGSGTISRINIKGKSELLFDKKDPGSKVLISWAGAITDPISGCKIIQISEGHPTNDNLNSQVTESEWDKDVSRLTKAKSVADLAEAELFNQGLFGLKWQDILLIVIGILCLAIIGYLFMGAPDAIAKKTIEGLMNGTIQQAITTGTQQALANAGILSPIPINP